ncbi:MAG: DNA primase [Candidatus Eisenbacteria sp.]|nr:DNA primase [Candidatus Eisenbacteria bacterium]
MDVSDYYRRVTDVDIGVIARELLGDRIVGESGQRLYCDCPRHESQSHKAFNVMLDLQGWHCFGCGVGGDVLQLVEFIQSGEVTKGVSGPMPESHRTARDFLAERVGLPPLGKNGASPDDVAAIEATRAEELRVRAALTSLAAYYHTRLMASPEALEWLQSGYGLSAETIETLKIGYAANDAWTDAEGQKYHGVIHTLTTGAGAFTLRELSATGAFRPTPQDTLAPFFDRRIVFPYWCRGRAAFLIGRKTPWTPESQWEQAKYKKLPVHDDEKRAYISPCITNAHLYNEDVLLTRPKRVVITEGVTDCIALMQHGFATVSPVTVRIRQADLERVVGKLGGVKTVYVCQDNEISGVGLEGALQTARVLGGHGIETRLVVLPLGEKQQEVRRQLRERFGIDSATMAGGQQAALARRSAEEAREAAQLLADAKIDVNEYFTSGHPAEDFQALLDDAMTPVEYGIAQLPQDVADDERDRLLRPLLREVATLDPLEQSRHLKRIQDHYGRGSITLATLRQQVKAIEREQRQREQERQRQRARRPTAPAGTCLALIEQALIDSEMETRKPDYTRAAEVAFEWFKENGARFFRTQQGEPFMFFEDALLWMDSGARGQRRLYESTIYKHAGIVPTTASGRTFFAVLSDLAAEHGEIRDHLSWLHTDVTQYTVYFNLNTPENEIAKITPDGVEILKNGDNADGIILASSRKMEPIRYLPEADRAAAERYLAELILNNLTCAINDRFLVVTWTSCFLLIEFTGTRPGTRFEGPAGSGKTTGSKIISTLLYGSPQQKKSTDAANYTDGSQNPLIVLDNIEARQMSEELLAFMLTCITGITKEKRKGGTDTETVIERTKCLLNTTGIEPLGAEYMEVLSRSFIIEFALDDRASDCFLEAKVLASIREHRDLILSALMQKTSRVLAMIRDGAQERVMRLLHKALGDHNKRRANDFLSLMYLMTLADDEPEDIEAQLETISPTFLTQIGALNTVTLEAARESNPIATVLAALFSAHRRAVAADRARVSLDVARTSVEVFEERYQVEIVDEILIRGVLARELFVALKRFAKDSGLFFPMNSVHQFAQRLSNDLDTIRESGFVININHLPQRVRTYDISFEARLHGAGEREPFTGEEVLTAQLVAVEPVAKGVKG